MVGGKVGGKVVGGEVVVGGQLHHDGQSSGGSIQGIEGLVGS